LSSLLQTIQNAFLITRALELRYLWANTLCIIQDYEEDLQKEFAMTSNVYEHADVTLVPASMSTSRAGFLQNRQPGMKISY
ncbi:hypothetical protein K469DRAFT_522920, partial [Zopfia rhizophila CBS 207.26]